MAKMEKIKENKAALKMLEEAIPRMVEYLTEFDIEKDEPYSYEITFDGRGIGVRLGTLDFDKPFNEQYAINFDYMEVSKND